MAKRAKGRRKGPLGLNAVPADDGPLTPLKPAELKFLELYIDSDCTDRVDSYIRAYPTCKHRSTARTAACELLNQPNVKAELRLMLEAARRRTRLSVSNVLRERRRIAFSDYGMLKNGDGTFKGLHELPPDVRRAIKAVKVQREVRRRDGEEEVVETVVGYEFWDKNAALTVLDKVLGITKDTDPLGVLLSQLPRTLADAVRAELLKGGQPPPADPAAQ